MHYAAVEVHYDVRDEMEQITTQQNDATAGEKALTSTAVDSAAAGLGTRANLTSTLIVSLAVAVYIVYAVRTGLPVTSAAMGLLSIAFTQVLPGALVWRTVRPRNGWLLEDLMAGFAIGSALAVPTQIVAGLTHQRWLAAAIPIAISLSLIAVPTSRRRIVEAHWDPIAWWFAPLLGLLSLIALPQFARYAQNNRISYPGPTSPQNDTYLHQALASELLNRGPVTWPTVAGEDLGYHWFTHAWIAQVAASSGIQLDEVLIRLMPALMPMAVVLAVGVAGLRLGRGPSVGVIAALITMAGSRFNFMGGSDLGLPLTPDSPTLALGAPTLTLLVTVIALRWRRKTLRGAFFLVPLLAVVAAGTKGSTSPLVVAGLALALVAMLFWNRRFVVPVLIDLVVVTAALGIAIVFVFKGSSAGLALGVTASSQQSYTGGVLHGLPSVSLIRLAAVSTILAGLSRAAGAFLLPFFRNTRRDPLSWLLMGAAIAGAFAPGLLSHPGRSQYYFYLTAIPLAALGSALGLDRLREAFGNKVFSQLLVLGAVGGAAFHFAPKLVLGPFSAVDRNKIWLGLGIGLAMTAAVALGAMLLRSARPRPLSVLSALLIALLTSGVAVFAQSFKTDVPPRRPVTLSSALAVSQGQIDVARYIRDHSDINDFVMTNRHCTVPRKPFDGCDSRRWIVTAFSERQSLVEGWTATPRATEIAPHGRDSVTVNYWRPDILRLNDGFTVAPTAQSQLKLWDLGVRWIYLENTIPHADTLEPFATERFATADASAWQMNVPNGR